MIMRQPAFVIGNGQSRQEVDLSTLREHGTIFGCNALYRDFEPDYLIAIDEAIISEIQNSSFPKEKCIFPPENERFEPAEVHYNQKSRFYGRPRSNAGMNAIIEAIRKGHTDLYCIGFDFLAEREGTALSNMYNGTPCYGGETRANLRDTRNRMRYFAWVIENSLDIMFHLCYPKGMVVLRPVMANVKLLNFGEMYEHLHSRS